MKKLTHIVLIAVVAVIGLTTVLSPSTYAVTANQSTRCNVTQARLNTRITQIETVKAAQTKVYTDLKAKVDSLVTSAKLNGYDVTSLTTARDLVADKVTTYTTKVSAYSAALIALKNLSCGDSDTAFATSLVAARAALVEAKTASVDVRTSFTTGVVPELKNYITWLNEQAASSKETN